MGYIVIFNHLAGNSNVALLLSPIVHSGIFMVSPRLTFAPIRGHKNVCSFLPEKRLVSLAVVRIVYDIRLRRGNSVI